MFPIGCEKRIAALYVILVLLMTVCLFSLYRTSTSTRAKAVLSGQYSRRLDVAERRGFIYDRSGKLLNAKKDGYICLVDPSRLEGARDTARLLSSASGHSESSVVEKLLGGVPFTLRLNDEVEDASGLVCYPTYSGGTSVASHVVGYVNSDGHGVTGAEKGFDGYLCGSLGGEVSYSYNADAIGRPMHGEGVVLHDKGYSECSGVLLTLDKELQEHCEAVAENLLSAGAVAVTDIKSGELLASVSLPSFEGDRIAQYLDSDGGELINRCAASFTPGSIFKTVVAASALESSIELYELEYECKGSYTLSDGTVFSCHNRAGHGKITMSEAYAQSCNPYFINLANTVGADKILDMAGKMGMGENELYGICSYGKSLPSAKSDEGFTANVAIGQGRLLISPYEACTVFGTAASGERTELFAVREIFRGESTLKRLAPKRIRILSDRVCELLREMMGLCVSDGLGSKASPEGGNAGGKTATAQTGQYKDGKEILNSWFCGVYPLSEPRYAITVLCDGNGGDGDTKAVFKSICEYLAESCNLYG